MAPHKKNTKVTLRWRVSRAAESELNAITSKKREAFIRSKGKKNPPVRVANLPGRYYLDIYKRGQRTSRALELYTTRDAQANDEAERLAREVERIAHDERWRTAHGFDTALAGSIPFVEFFRSLVPGRPGAWRACQLLLEQFPNGTTPVDGIDKAWLEAFKEFLLAFGTRNGGTLRQNSASTYFAKVKAALNIAVDRKLIPAVPRVKAIPMIDTERSYLSQDELQALANAPCPDAETKRAFLFACYTGLRISDIKALRWRHVQNGRLEKRIKKTNKVQYLDLPVIAQKLLANGGGHHSPDEKVFELMHERLIWDALQTWAKSAKLAKHISFHTARHSFAVLALTHTKDLYLVSSLLNHSNIRETQIYAKIVDDRRRQAMMSLPEIEI